MKKETVSKQSLELLSTAELISLADEYGIVIPEDLNRYIIIGEILEAYTENETAQKSESDIKINDSDTEIPDELPSTYNNTCIDTVLRSPAWAFVFWDIKESDLSRIQSDSAFKSIFLHITFPQFPDEEKVTDYLDLSAEFDTREQYILVPAGKKFMKIDLAISYRERQSEVLASTRVVEIPQENPVVQDYQPGKKIEMTPLVKLSGMKEILNEHYVNHRQSFSN